MLFIVYITLDCMQNVPFFVQKIGGAKLYWNKFIQRWESTQHIPNQNNLSILKDNQQKFVKKYIKNYDNNCRCWFCFCFYIIYIPFISTSVFICFYLKISYLAVRIKLCWLRMVMDDQFWFTQTNFYALLSGHFAWVQYF
jgi:hypothetical protein